MTVRSAGILLYRHGAAGGLETLDSAHGRTVLGRQAGPLLVAPQGRIPARRRSPGGSPAEFTEEIGTPPPAVDYFPLGAFRQPSGKVITVFAAESDFSLAGLSATRSPWSGRKARGPSRTFRRSTTPGGSPTPRPAPSLSRASFPSLMPSSRHLLQRQDHP